MKTVPPARIPANKVVARKRSRIAHTPAGTLAAAFQSVAFFMKFFPLRPCIAAAALPVALIACANVRAQSSLPEVIVTASRAEQRLHDSMSPATLITRADIERAQALDLPDLLRRVGGVEIAQAGPAGTLASVFIRGAESRHVLVLIDGVPVNNLNFNTAAIEHLPLADIERIEVVNGNVSALYGSSALGGVIQVFTRAPSLGGRGQASIQFGSHGLVQASASASQRLSSGTLVRGAVESLSLGGFDATDQVQRPGTNPDRDGYRRRAISLGLSQELGKDASIGLQLRNTTGTTQYDSQFGPSTQTDAARFGEQSALLDASARPTANLKLRAALAQSADRLNANVTAYPYWVNSRKRNAQFELEWTPIAQHKLTAGLERTQQSLASDTVYNQHERTQASARVGLMGSAGAHQWQINLRYDRYSDFGSAQTWMLGWAVRPTQSLRLSAMRSTGFNAPTFNDLYYPWGGNANLVPERLKSTELGVQYLAGGKELRLTWFDNRFTDLIDNDAAFNRVNVARARNRGLELRTSARIGNTQLRADLTSQNPVDQISGKRLSRRADAMGSFSLQHDRGPWKLDANLRATAMRFDEGRALSGYAVLDLRAAYALSRDLQVFGRIDNLFDRQYQSVYGYTQPGRGLFAGARWQFAR